MVHALSPQCISSPTSASLGSQDTGNSGDKLQIVAQPALGNVAKAASTVAGGALFGVSILAHGVVTIPRTLCLVTSVITFAFFKSIASLIGCIPGCTRAMNCIENAGKIAALCPLVILNSLGAGIQWMGEQGVGLLKRGLGKRVSTDKLLSVFRGTLLNPMNDLKIGWRGITHACKILRNGGK